MKNYSKLLITTCIGLSALTVYSQSLDLPRPSPNASVMQMIGLTKVQIDYSAPAVKGRAIWGTLVPYDQVWRTGANSATAITFGTDVLLNGQKLKAGKYGLFTIPGKDEWTIIINSNDDQWGAYGYKQDMDVLRFKVKPETVELKERLAFYIDPISDSKGRVTLQWEKLKIGFDVENDAQTLASKNIESFVDKSKGLWSSYANAANYYVDNKLDLDKAKEWAQLSLNMHENHFFNHYVMARVLEAKGDDKEAEKQALEAKKAGEAANDDFYKQYKERVEKLVAQLNTKKKK